MDENEYENSAEDVMKDRKEEQAGNQEGRLRSMLRNRISNSRAGKAVRKLKNKAKKVAKESVKNAVKTGAKTVGGIIASILIVLFMVIGIVQFIISMPGLVQDAIWQKFETVMSGVKEFFLGTNNGLNDKEITKDTKIAVLQYIQDMGFDVVGYGFVSIATVNANGDVIDFDDNYFTDQLINDEDSKKMTLYRYIVGALRIYTINDDGFLNFGKFFDVNDQRGMLNILDQGLADLEIFYSVDIDRKVLDIKNLNPHLFSWLNMDEFSFNLDGWSSRYGFPLDLTMTLHLATMSSGLAEELITNPYLQTMVNIDLEEVKASVSYVLKNADGLEIKYSDGSRFDGYQYRADLYQMYLDAGEDVNNISVEDWRDAISIWSLIDLVACTQLENADCDGTYEYNDVEVKGSQTTFGGLQKNIEAMDAMTSSHDFLASNVNRIWGWLSTSSYADIFYGSYICDVDDNGEIIPNGVLGTTSIDYYSGEMHSFEKKVDGQYVLMEGEEKYDAGSTNMDVTLYPSNAYNYDSPLLNVKLTGLNRMSSMSFTTTALSALQDFDDVDDMIDTLRDKTRWAWGSNNNDGEYMIGYDGQSGFIGYDYVQENVGQSNAENSFTRLLAYANMFKQIDEFIGAYALNNMIDCDRDDNNVRIVTDDHLNYLSNQFYYDFNNYYEKGEEGYYRHLFTEMCRDAVEGNGIGFYKLYNSYTDENGNELPSVLEQLEHDKTIIQIEVANRNQILQDILNRAGYGGLDMSVVYQVYQNAQFDNGDVDFVQPRIVSVIKHWYKDVDFGGDDDIAYSKSSDPIEMPYTGESGLDDDEWFVTAVVDPSDGEVYTQTGEPYVIKGDLVTMDGEVVENPNLTDLTDEDESGLDSKIVEVEFDGDTEDYNWGDGYRMTKKIFTEGFYYTFDGSQDTTRSIYYQEQMENYSNQVCYISVMNGRIQSLMPMTEGNNYPAVNLSSGYNGWGQLTSMSEAVSCSVPGVSIRYVGETERARDNQKVKWYVLNFDASKPMEYLSTTRKKDVSYDEAKERVYDINKVWDAVGVTVKRKPLSFDNKDAEGNVMTTTAFSILQNSKSEDAEVIYRDLKELLIDLGYFSKAEFDALERDVLTWFIPDYKPRTWPQNTLDDSMYHGCMLYPFAEEPDDSNAASGSGTNGGSTSNTNTSTGTTNVEGRSDGFVDGLSVIAPGDCIITEKTNDTIKLKFDATEQPEISAVDGYEMIIKGVKPKDNTVVVDEHDVESNLSIASAIENKTVIPSGTVIAETGTTKIQVVMKTSRGALINNVNDYMSPGIIGSIGDLEWLYFYYIPYESGNIDDLTNGAGQAASFEMDGQTEYAVGICQWTIRGSMDLVKPLLVYLYQTDPSTCAEFAAFQSWSTSQITSNYDQVQEAFHKINERDPERFLQLQMEYALQEKTQTINDKGLGWTFDRNGVVVGSLMSLINWRPGWAWQDYINESMSDEEIIKTLFARAYSWSTGSDATAAWQSRWESQARVAVDILNGSLKAEDFVRNGAQGELSEYANGNNAGYLRETLRSHGW